MLLASLLDPNHRFISAMQRMRHNNGGRSSAPPIAKPRMPRPGTRPSSGNADISMQDRMNEFLGHTNDHS